MRGYKVVREYEDQAISGDDTERRDGFLQLREDAERRGDFGIILAWDQDRFSRNDPLELGYWLKPIRDAIRWPPANASKPRNSGKFLHFSSMNICRCHNVVLLIVAGAR